MIYDTNSDKYSWYLDDNNFYEHTTKLVNSTDYDPFVHFIQFRIILKSWLDWSSLAIVEDPDNTSEDVRVWGMMISAINGLDKTFDELELNIPITKEHERQLKELSFQFNKIGEKYGYSSYLIFMYLSGEPLKNFIKVISKYDLSVTKILKDIGEVAMLYKQNELQKRN